MANPNIAELGKPYQFQPGNKVAVGKGRPVLDPVERMLREAAREKRLAEQWIADLEDSDPDIRLATRKDLMDRINGKAPQSVAVTVEKLDPDTYMEGVEPW